MAQDSAPAFAARQWVLDRGKEQTWSGNLLPAPSCVLCLWSSQAGPLQACFSRLCFNPPGEGCYDPSGWSLLDAPVDVNSEEDYERAASHCELLLELTAEQHARVAGLLYYDRRQRGSRGRALKAA
eukprot:6011004-Alexandrium_andersonii.AAC.1